MHPTWKLALAADVQVAVADSAVTFERDGQRLCWRGLSAGACTAFRDLAAGSGIPQLLSAVRQGNASGESSAFLAKLRLLANGGWLRISVDTNGGPAATLEILTREFSLDLPATLERCMLSRFVYVHRAHNGLILETPLAAARIELHSPLALELFFRLRQPMTLDELQAAFPADNEAATGLLTLFHVAGMLTAADAAGAAAEDATDGLQFWEFHDLLFHARSREGRHNAPLGATFDWAGFIDPPPAVMPQSAQPAIALAAPEHYPSDNPASFANIVERRSSQRTYGAVPLSDTQLGQFLYRVGRVKARFSAELDTWNGPVMMDFAARPYPSAGALYEIELYPLVLRCEGLAAGLYHYDAVRHALVAVDADPTLTSRLAADAGRAAMIAPEELQVLMILSARFPRLMWKYCSMAYAVILKNVGVLYESMYLTATDLQLAPCAVGIGNSDVFSRALKSDYYAETSVGEFLLGSRVDSGAATGQ